MGTEEGSIMRNLITYIFQNVTIDLKEIKFQYEELGLFGSG